MQLQSISCEVIFLCQHIRTKVRISVVQILFDKPCLEAIGFQNIWLCLSFLSRRINDSD